MDEYSQMIILVILIGLSGFFSASETALTAFKRIKLKEVEKENPNAAKKLKIWLKRPNEILTAILLGNNIVNILASSMATIFVGDILKKKGVSGSMTIFVVTGMMTIIILIFGEITPKIIAKTYSNKVSRTVILPMYYFSVITFPIIAILIFISRTLSKIFGISIKNENLLITEEDIRSIVNVGEEEGILEEEEKDMIHSIFDFANSTVKEVMIPRTSIFVLEASKILEDVWDSLIEKGYSRIPVYEERIDNIIGVVYLKDLLTVAKEGKLNLPVKEFIREAYFIPDSKLLVDLLKEFREKQIHIAIALDEYGGTVGLVTIEDLLEEIVGEINDEYDEEEEKVKKISENIFKVEAMLDIETLNKTLSISLPEMEEYESLGGFIYYSLGKVPEIGDEVNFENIDVKVMKVENHKIQEVLLEIKEEGIDR